MSWDLGRPDAQVLRESQGKRILQRMEPIWKTLPATTLTFFYEVTNPSTRVSGEVEVFFEPDNDIDDAVTNWLTNAWKITARARGINKITLPLHQVDPLPPATSVALPRAYEWASQVKRVRLEIDLETPQKAGPTDVPGIWYIRAQWEPNVLMSDEELNDIFSDCQLTKI